MFPTKFQRRRLKCETLTDDRRRTTDAKWWQKLTLPLARWAKQQLIWNHFSWKYSTMIFKSWSSKRPTGKTRFQDICFNVSYHHFLQYFSYILTTKLNGGEKFRQIFNKLHGGTPCHGGCLIGVPLVMWVSGEETLNRYNKLIRETPGHGGCLET